MNGKLKEAFAEALGIAVDDLDDDASPETVDEWDSVATLAIISEVESQFDIKISLKDAAGLGDLHAWQSYVDRKMQP